MKTCKVIFKPKTSIITPLQADTIWGSICWALRYLDGEQALTKFLDVYKRTPPLILSDGFPEGFLPKPILKPVSHQDVNALAKKYFGEDKKSLVECLMRIKRLRKEKYISHMFFYKIKDDLSEMKILDELLQQKENIQPEINLTLVFRNTINRFTNTVLSEGGLHPDEEVFYNNNIEIFLKTGYFAINQLKEIFEFITLSGFGRSASSGKGAMDLISIEEAKIPEVENPNAFMSLSSFVPSENDPVNGYYQIMTKYGKLGGEYARIKNPFKKPIVMFTAGSVFFDNSIREYYGRLIDNIHSDETIKHYAYAFPIGVRVNENL